MITSNQIHELAEDCLIYRNARVPDYSVEQFAKLVYEQAIADVLGTMRIKRTTEQRVLECLNEN